MLRDPDRESGPARRLLGARAKDGSGEPVAGGLRDGPVLAVQAVEVAAPRGDREGHAAGVDVEERLLLDRVGVGGDGPPVHERDQRAVAILADAADPGPTGSDQAAMGAGDAADGAVAPRTRPGRRAWPSRL